MSKPTRFGHNGAPIYESRSDLPDNVPQLEWFKCNAREFLDDLLRLPLDERGFYASAVMVMYAEMETLPADERMAAHRLAMDVRSYRAFLKKLSERKSATSEVPLLYKRPSGRVSNHRYEEEITAYVDLVKKRREAASEREERRKIAKVHAQQSVNSDQSTEPVHAEIDRDLAGMSEGSPPIPATSNGHSIPNEASIADGSSQKNQQNQCEWYQSTASRVADDCQTTATERDRERESPIRPPEGGSRPLLFDEQRLPDMDEIDVAFEKFWKLFPPGRKQGKGEAAKLFRRIVTRRHRDRRMHATIDVLLAAVERFAKSPPKPEFAPLPQTWLNGGRWMDDVVATTKSVTANTKALAESLERARALEEAEPSPWVS